MEDRLTIIFVAHGSCWDHGVLLAGQSLTKEKVGSNYMILGNCFLSDPGYTVLARHLFLLRQCKRDGSQKQSCLGRG